MKAILRIESRADIDALRERMRQAPQPVGVDHYVLRRRRACERPAPGPRMADPLEGATPDRVEAALLRAGAAGLSHRELAEAVGVASHRLTQALQERCPGACFARTERNGARRYWHPTLRPAPRHGGGAAPVERICPDCGVRFVSRRLRCPDCTEARAREWHREDQRRRRAEQGDRVRETQRQWRARNPEKTRRYWETYNAKKRQERQGGAA